MRAQQFLWTLLLIALSGCGVKVTSVCGGHGACCALSGSITSYTCEKTEAACISKTTAYPGSKAEYPFDVHNHKKEDIVKDGCKVETQDVGIWDDDPFEFKLRAKLKYPLPQTIMTSDGRTFSADDPQYCRAMCQTTDADLCPVMAMRSDVQLGLLFTVARAAQNPPKMTTVVPIGDILAEFAVPESANLCGRGDLILSPTNSLNIGSGQCRTEITSESSVGELTAELTAENVLEGQILSADSVAQYLSEDRRFTISINDKYYSDYFSGPVTRIGIVNVDNVFGQISAKNGPACAALVPYEEDKYNFGKMSEFVTKTPSSVASFLKDISAYRNKVSKVSGDAERDVETIEVGDALFPYTRYLDMLAEIGAKHGQPSPLPARVSDLPDTAPDFDQFLNFIDADLCSRAMTDTPAEDLIHLIPKYGEGNRTIDSLLLEREGIAAKILLCKFSSQKITAAARDVIEKQIKRMK